MDFVAKFIVYQKSKIRRYKTTNQNIYYVYDTELETYANIINCVYLYVKHVHVY